MQRELDTLIEIKTDDNIAILPAKFYLNEYPGNANDFGKIFNIRIDDLTLFDIVSNYMRSTGVAEGMSDYCYNYQKREEYNQKYLWDLSYKIPHFFSPCKSFNKRCS